MRVCPWTTLLIWIFCISIGLAQAQEGGGFTYVWSPRKTDIGPRGSKDYAVFKALLALCATEQYTPENTEELDFVIREKFLVSSTPYPHAYSLYLNRIQELNGDRVKSGIVQKHQAIVLPSGPKFGASELSDLNLNAEDFSSAFEAMSQAAYQVQQDVQQHVRKHAVATLKYFVSSNGKSSDEELFNRIRGRGLVYATPTNAETGSARPPVGSLPAVLEAIDLKATNAAQRAQENVIKQNDPDRMLPAQIILAPSQPRMCPNSLTDSNQWMAIPSDFDFGNVKVLIVDTGIQNGYMSSANVVKLTSNDAGADVSDEFHGTFVYSEIAKSPNAAQPQKLFGAIPQSDIYVAGAATRQGVSVFFNSSDIIRAWNTFNAQNASVRNIASTRVVNLSVFGGQVLDPDSSAPMSPPIPSGMLIIAAAGNNGTPDDAKLHAFARYSNGNVPIVVVGALDANGKPATYSNWSTQYVQLFAPGDCVRGSPSQIDGTSQAAPFVTIAAAAIAARHPNWTPMWVMWRLLSTADHPAELQTKSLAGKVNLTRALANTIYLEEKSANGDLIPHEATAITYDQGWKNAFAETGSNQHNNESLRLYPNSTTRADGAICFTTLNFLSFSSLPTCVQPSATVQLTENGVPTSPIAASAIVDLILPMPPIVGSEPILPNVVVSGSQ